MAVEYNTSAVFSLRHVENMMTSTETRWGEASLTHGSIIPHKTLLGAQTIVYKTTPKKSQQHGINDRWLFPFVDLGMFTRNQTGSSNVSFGGITDCPVPNLRGIYTMCDILKYPQSSYQLNVSFSRLISQKILSSVQDELQP